MARWGPVPSVGLLWAAPTTTGWGGCLSQLSVRTQEEQLGLSQAGG